LMGGLLTQLLFYQRRDSLFVFLIHSPRVILR
jgi:hypothetical protein